MKHDAAARASSPAARTSCDRARSGLCAGVDRRLALQTASRRSCSADGRSPAAPTLPGTANVAPRSNRRDPIAAKSVRRGARRIDELETPGSVERHAPRRRSPCARGVGRRIRRQRHAHRQTIQRNALRLFPHRRGPRASVPKRCMRRRRFERTRSVTAAVTAMQRPRGFRYPSRAS